MVPKRMFLFIFYFYCFVNCRAACARIFVKIDDPDGLSHYYRNIMSRNGYRHSRNYNDVELITRAIEIIKEEQSGVNALEINKCLNAHFGNTKNKFSCIKRLIDKSEADKINDKTNFFNKERLRHENNDKFSELIKSGNKNDATGMFQTILHFSQDYLDIDDLFRDDKSIGTRSTEKLDISRKIPHENNKFEDLQKFSQDYLDTNDLLRRNNKVANEKAKEINNIKNNKSLSVFKLIPMDDAKLNETENRSDAYIFNPTQNRQEVKNLRRFRNILPKDFIKSNILRTMPTDSNDSSDESTSTDDTEERINLKASERNKNKLIISQIIDKSYQDKSSKENSRSNESDFPMQRPIDVPKTDKKIYYMQAPSRILKVGHDSRRRLPYFLPKRYHWPVKDMTNLQYYWFSGRQGKYWGPHKTPY